MQRGIVWVVDDDSSIRWVLERALAGAGLTCTTFENGAEVLEALASKTPDVLLSDIRMPGMDGLALLKQIKQRHPMLPVIIMTAHSDYRVLGLPAYQEIKVTFMQRGIVWVVDDDSSIRWVLERALAGAGLTCTTFENGAEVLEALASKTPDVLLSDIRMPGMDGLALLKQIKQRHPMLPVIIMTAHSDLDAAVSAYQQGAFDYLPKPFDIDEAVALVERAISHYQEQQQPRNVQLNGPTTDIIGFQISVCREWTGWRCSSRLNSAIRCFRSSL